MNSFKISIIKAEKQVTELNKCGKQNKVKICETRLKKVRDCEHMTFFGISSKNFYAYF